MHPTICILNCHLCHFSMSFVLFNVNCIIVHCPLYRCSLSFCIILFTIICIIVQCHLYHCSVSFGSLFNVICIIVHFVSFCIIHSHFVEVEMAERSSALNHWPGFSSSTIVGSSHFGDRICCSPKMFLSGRKFCNYNVSRMRI